MNQKENKPIEIYAGSSWEVELLKTILEDHQIKCFVKDEFIGTIAPHHTVGAGSVKLWISENDYERAQPLINKFEKNKTY